MSFNNRIQMHELSYSPPRQRRVLPLLLQGGLVALVLIVVGLWLRSYWVQDEAVFPTYESLHGESHYSIESDRGWLRLRRVTILKPASVYLNDGFDWGERRVVPDSGWMGLDEPSSTYSWYALGFGYLEGDYDARRVAGAGLPYWVVVIPHWFVAVLLGLVPLIRLLRSLRRWFARRDVQAAS